MMSAESKELDTTNTTLSSNLLPAFRNIGRTARKISSKRSLPPADIRLNSRNMSSISSRKPGGIRCALSASHLSLISWPARDLEKSNSAGDSRPSLFTSAWRKKLSNFGLSFCAKPWRYSSKVNAPSPSVSRVSKIIWVRELSCAVTREDAARKAAASSAARNLPAGLRASAAEPASPAASRRSLPACARAASAAPRAPSKGAKASARMARKAGPTGL
mmetsp:Transcript_77772/g.225695  ORF Transcript_77772/g.225695 Transcript_77772/m.225695 type:complete len:218 (-) Transcript_77772:44-697(-)